MNEDKKRYTCPKCKKVTFVAILDDDNASCLNCDYVGSLYEAPMDEWETTTYGRKDVRKPT